MNIVVGTDEDRAVVSFICAHLEARGLRVTRIPTGAWGPMAQELAAVVGRGDASFGVVCCFTGTGVAMAANRVKGVRAALCGDAETAIGARKWNDANVLALSLRLTTETLAAEILDAWLSADYSGTEDESLARL